MQGASFSILGDSYSTFAGYIPEGNACYYPRPESVDDVLEAHQTWWHILSERYGMHLLINNSYSGATVCTQVRETQPKEASYVVRAQMSFGVPDGEKPDYIFVFGGTNDSWINRTIGCVQFENWTEKDLENVLPAYCFVLDTLIRRYPNTKIVSIINTELQEEIAEGFLIAGKHYGVISVQLRNIDKQNGHPSALGMQKIAQQVGVAIEGHM